MYSHWVPCECNPSYNLMPIFALLFSIVWRCACGLNIIFVLIFVTFSTFVIFWPQILWKCIASEYLVSTTLRTILYQYFWNFAHVFSMVWRCACGLDIVLELIFVTFFHFVNFVISLTSDSMNVYRQWVPCKRNSLCNFIPIFMQLCTSF